MSDIECCLQGPGRTPLVTICGIEYVVKSGTFKHIPRKKVVTEKRALTNQRRRQISWDPEQWEFTIAACSLAEKSTLQECYQGETYASYVYSFSYRYDYNAHTGSQNVTFDEFDPSIVNDNPERWDVGIKLTEWL